MTRGGRLVAILTTLAVATTACGAPAPDDPTAPPLTSGGILRIGIVERPPDFNDPYPYDYHDPWLSAGALFRCCLLRTLLSYNGHPTEEGGTVPRPDLADGAPRLSPDGLTWTFTIRRAIRYAPPYQDREVVAADFVRGLERSIRAEPYVGDLTSVIRGVAEFRDGVSSTIGGLEVPDDDTLVVRLTESAGVFAHLAALPAFAPIPEGAADGHETDYGRHLVALGPYMFESTAGGERAGAGLPDHAINLVRNPSWDRQTDPLRHAYVDRIEIAPAGGFDEAIARVDAGELDLLDLPLRRAQVQAGASDPARAARLYSGVTEYSIRIPMNLAVPPFDDINVRRAVNFAVDKATVVEGVIRARASDQNRIRNDDGVIARHAFPDSTENGLLIGYDPYATAGDRGDIARAKAEMARSRYDHDGDGMCDDPVCRRVLAAYGASVGGDLEDPTMASDSLRERLAEIEVQLDLREADEAFGTHNATARVGIAIELYGWGSDRGPDAADIAVLLQGGDMGDGTFVINESLVGALPEQLEAWGYPVTEVPSLDSKIATCARSVSYLRFSCWAELDKLVTEQVVPWVPLLLDRRTWLVSPRIESFEMDQSVGTYPALDQISLKPGV